MLPAPRRRLNGGEGGVWFAHESNPSYVYFNGADDSWWIDGPNGLGVYKAPGLPWQGLASHHGCSILTKHLTI